VRLEQEQAAETSKTDWCAQTLKELKTDKSNAQTDFDDAVTAVKTDEELISVTTEARKEKRAERKEAEKAKAELEEVLASKALLNEEIRGTKKQAINGISDAITVLEVAFAGEGKAARDNAASTQATTRSNTGQTIINLIKKILGEEKNEAEVANMEVQCKEGETYKPLGDVPDAPCRGGYVYTDGATHAPSTTYETVQMIERTEVNIRDLTMTIEVQTKLIADTKVSLDQNVQDRDAKDGLHESARNSLKARQEACVNAGDSFEARAKRRKEEMASLKEALEILESHSANSEKGAAASFLQRH